MIKGEPRGVQNYVFPLLNASFPSLRHSRRFCSWINQGPLGSRKVQRAAMYWAPGWLRICLLSMLSTPDKLVNRLLELICKKCLPRFLEEELNLFKNIQLLLLLLFNNRKKCLGPNPDSSLKLCSLICFPFLLCLHFYLN